MKIRPHYLAAFLVFSAFSGGVPLLTSAAAQQEPAADNTKMNKGASPTAEQQSNNSTDQAITKKIRSSVVGDKSLSTDAHNVKIITQEGKVTLKGPVRSDDEKSNIENKAVAVAGSGNVDDQITVAPKQ
jgi:osmotically-inducible protein OsmY